MAQYTPHGAGVVDQHSSLRTTTAGVFIGDDGLMVLEIEDQHRFHTAREYAEIAMSLEGFRKLRDLMTSAIARAEGE
jgi:hypothetical protein